MLNQFYYCLCAVMARIKPLQRQKVAYNTGINNVSIYFIPYVICCLTAAYQGITKGKTENNIIYKYQFSAHYTTTKKPVREGIINSLTF